jgi:hypothetical protein
LSRGGHQIWATCAEHTGETQPRREEIYGQAPLFESIAAVPTLALTQSAKCDDVLREPAPKQTLELARIMWHHARGVAYARTARPDSAERELSALRTLAAEIPRE